MRRLKIPIILYYSITYYIIIHHVRRARPTPTATPSVPHHSRIFREHLGYRPLNARSAFHHHRPPTPLQWVFGVMWSDGFRRANPTAVSVVVIYYSRRRDSISGAPTRADDERRIGILIL